ncbi:MAG: ABC transporter permease [Acidobacteriota bacterium]
MSMLLQDLRYAVRSLAKSPGFAAVALVTLAIGIGVNVTVFSWIEGVLLRPLPAVPDADRIVTLETVAPSGELIDTSYPDYRDYRDQARSFAGLLAFKDRPLDLREGENSERIWGEVVSGNFFDVLGLTPERGRFFTPEESREAAGSAPLVVLSHRLWTRRFRSDPAIIGRAIELNRIPLTVIGVAPPGFEGTIVGLSYDVYVPLFMQERLTGGGAWLENRRSRPLHVLARLAPGVSLSSAQVEVAAIAKRAAAGYPASNLGIGARLLPLARAPYGGQSVLSDVLRILMAVSAVVLLIVCANLANLLLAFASGRRREIAIRLALGATRRRLLRQFLTESMLLAAVGAASGALAAVWMSDLLRMFVPPTDLPLSLTSALDMRVLGFTGLLALAAGVAFGMPPALALLGREGRGLRESGRGATAGRESHRLRSTLVAAEVALALVALAGAGLFLKSFRNAVSMRPGFEPRGVLLAGMNLSSAGYDAERGRVFYRRLQERLAALPGVTSVAVAEDVPLGFNGGSWEDLAIDGYTPRPVENMKIYRNLVSPGYFDLLKIPLRGGRDFVPKDGADSSPLVAIVNETFVQRFFAGRDPVGRRVRGWGQDITVVGVVGDHKYRSLAESPQPYFYVPFERFYRASTGAAVHIRVARDPARVLPEVRRAIRSLDPNVTVIGMAMTDYVAASAFDQRLAATLLTVLGVLAVVLAAMGLYSVIAYSVSRRTQEIGIRMALGARPSDILRRIVAQGLVLAGAGLAAGLAAALVLGRFIASSLLGVPPWDPGVLGGVALLLAAIAFAASAIPARRAARLDPAIALRHE